MQGGRFSSASGSLPSRLTKARASSRLANVPTVSLWKSSSTTNRRPIDSWYRWSPSGRDHAVLRQREREHGVAESLLCGQTAVSGERIPSPLARSPTSEGWAVEVVEIRPSEPHARCFRQRTGTRTMKMTGGTLLDRIQKSTEDALDRLEANVRRLGRWLASHLESQRRPRARR